MSEIFFIDDQHHKNYNIMKEMYPKALTNKEYQAACYVSAVPLIFGKFDDKLCEFSNPLEWIFKWENQMQREEQINAIVDYDLTPSMQQLGKLALHLWNGYEHFNLMDCLNRVDDENFLVVEQAIAIRKRGVINIWI